MPFKVTKKSEKIIHITYGKKVKPFNITAISPTASAANDTDLKHDINKVDRYYITNRDKTQLPSKSFQQPDPRNRSKPSCKAVEQEITGLLDKGAFKFVEINQIPKEANVLGGRFILVIKTI